MTPKECRRAREAVSRIEDVGANRARTLRLDLELWLASGGSGRQ